MALKIGFFVFPGFQLLDLSGPLATFQVADRVATTAPYRLHVMSAQGGLVASNAGLEVATVPAATPRLDTLIIAGGSGTRTVTGSAECLAIVRRLAARARRVASVCTGAFILAAAGLLDGRRATTHWRYATMLQRGYPKVDVNSDSIFVKDGPVWTSAGITAGIDLALALVEEDLGAELSRAVARELVVYHRRPGGQTQFSAMLDLEPDSDRIRRALTFAHENLNDALSVDRLADVACLSPRQFGRAFRAETGETPAKAVERLRAEAALARVETSVEPIEDIAASVGFSDPERMRRAFLRRFGHPPQAMRRAARRTPTAAVLAHDAGKIPLQGTRV